MGLFNRPRWLDLQAPKPSDILLPDPKVFRDQPGEPLDLLTLAQDEALKESTELAIRPVVEMLVKHFSSAENDAEQQRYVQLVCSRSAAWGWGVGAIEARKFSPPNFKIHPVTHSALALAPIRFPDDLFDDEMWKVAASYCMRVGYYYYRLGDKMFVQHHTSNTT